MHNIIWSLGLVDLLTPYLSSGEGGKNASKISPAHTVTRLRPPTHTFNRIPLTPAVKSVLTGFSQSVQVWWNALRIWPFWWVTMCVCLHHLLQTSISGAERCSQTDGRQQGDVSWSKYQHQIFNLFIKACCMKHKQHSHTIYLIRCTWFMVFDSCVVVCNWLIMNLIYWSFITCLYFYLYLLYGRSITR